MIEIKAPFSDEDMEKLVCGDIIKLSGVIYTGRDAAHKRMIDAINNDRKPYIDAYAGRNALELVLAIYKSQKTGDVVKLPLEDFSSMDMMGEF